MKISAVLWCKDEVALLPLAVAQLLRAGVHAVWIMDDGSTDGTATAISAMAAVLPNLHVCPRVENLREALAMDGPVFGPILAHDNPDWLLVGDPDEFWIPRNGDLRTLGVLRTMDVVMVDRFNAALSTGAVPAGTLGTSAGLAALPLLVDRTPMSREAMAADPDLRWIEHRVGPKLMVRPDRIASFGLGMHQVAGAAQTDLRRATARNLVIAHLPFTSFERFARKVRNIAEVFARFDADHGGTAAWHWRRWLEIAERGGLREEYDRQFFPPDTLARMHAAGRIATASELFARRDAEARRAQTASRARP